MAGGRKGETLSSHTRGEEQAAAHGGGGTQRVEARHIVKVGDRLAGAVLRVICHPSPLHQVRQDLHFRAVINDLIKTCCKSSQGLRLYECPVEKLCRSDHANEFLTYNGMVNDKGGCRTIDVTAQAAEHLE